MVTCLQTTKHKTNQKTHANQLILDKLIGGFCYGPRGQETPISQASKIFWVRIQTLNIMVSLKLSIYLSKINFKHFDYNEFSGFCQVERSQDVSRTLYLMAKPQGDPYLK